MNFIRGQFCDNKFSCFVLVEAVIRDKQNLLLSEQLHCSAWLLGFKDRTCSVSLEYGSSSETLNDTIFLSCRWGRLRKTSSSGSFAVTSATRSYPPWPGSSDDAKLLVRGAWFLSLLILPCPGGGGGGRGGSNSSE